MTITRRELTRDTWEECVDLEVAEHQRNFVSPNLVSLAEAQFYPGTVCRAVYAGDVMVGFVMYGPDAEYAPGEPGAYAFVRFMIDRRTFLAAAACLAARSASAQPAGGPRRIAFLTAFDRSNVEALVKPILAELGKLGWPEVRAIVMLEPRFADGVYDRLPAMAEELVALKPDVILVQGRCGRLLSRR